MKVGKDEMRKMKNRKGVVHVSSDHGHRASYRDLIVDHLGFEPSVGHIGLNKWWELTFAPKLFFATIDDDLRGALFVVLSRALLGRKTSGLFLRAGQCFVPGARFAFKRFMFFIWSRIPGCSLFSIIPFGVSPKLSSVTSSWVHDPQLWDQTECDLPCTSLSKYVTKLGEGRKVILFLGVVTNYKGFNFFCDIAKHTLGVSDKFVFVAVGEVSTECVDSAREFEKNGGLIVDRYVDDDELLSLFPASNIIWSCYDPSYDQASGAFGRSVQFGCTTLVRRGSIVERYAAYLDAPAIPIDFGDVEGSSGVIMSSDVSADNAIEKRVLAAWRRDFFDKITLSM